MRHPRRQSRPAAFDFDHPGRGQLLQSSMPFVLSETNLSQGSTDKLDRVLPAVFEDDPIEFDKHDPSRARKAVLLE